VTTGVNERRLRGVSSPIRFIFLKDGQERTEEVVKIEGKAYVLKVIIRKKNSFTGYDP
jgi:hypothetical protein